MKNFFKFPVFVVLFFSFVGMIGYGSILKYHYVGGKKYQFLQKPVIFFTNASFIILKNFKDGHLFNFNIPPKLRKHKDKERFKQFIENKRNALLVLPRYEHSLKKSVIDIIDLNNFEIIHTYRHDIAEMNNQVTNTKEFPKIKLNASPTRFAYRHPILLEDGSIISDSFYSVEFKIDFCSNLQWINDDEKFHHSKELDHEGNIWVPGQMNPKSQYIKKYSIEKFQDDSIIKINTDGKILFNKSVTEILIENNIVRNNFAYTMSMSNEYDPIHLNDIQPAFKDSEYWQQGDIFLSLRNQSAIIHYRPITNKVINFITGPFAQQHDVDIISDKEISIFNNNNFFDDNEYSEVIIYNFETKKFRKLFNNQFQKENLKTSSEGLSHILKDGSLMVEEQNHGRIVLFNNKGEKEWEFVNKDKNGDIGFVFWSRIIEDEMFVKNFKLLAKKRKCLN